jgi:hypothetical protein
MTTKRHIYRVTSCEVAGTNSLRLKFDDGLERTIDFLPILEGDMFGPLKDPAVFGAVRLDPESHTVVWPNGADMDPGVLHDWPDYEQEMLARAGRWRTKSNAAFTPSSEARCVAEPKAEYGKPADRYAQTDR